MKIALITLGAVVTVGSAIAYQVATTEVHKAVQPSPTPQTTPVVLQSMTTPTPTPIATPRPTIRPAKVTVAPTPEPTPPSDFTFAVTDVPALDPVPLCDRHDGTDEYIRACNAQTWDEPVHP